MSVGLLLLVTTLLLRLCGASKPDVLLLMVDDLRPALGVYGDPNAHTPNVDKLAAKSFVFTKVFAQVLGIWSLFYALEIFLITYDDDKLSLLYYWFVAGAVIQLLKGCLLLNGIRKGKRLQILTYFIITTLMLFIAKAFIIRLGIDKYREIEKLQSEQASESEIRPILRGFAFDFVVFYPLIFLFHWFVQFYAFLYYRGLVKVEPALKLNRQHKDKMSMIGEKSY